MTFCHGRRTVPRATLTMTKSHGQKIGWAFTFITHTHLYLQYQYLDTTDSKSIDFFYLLRKIFSFGGK